MRQTANYDDNVFINCPFDDEYNPLFMATTFTIFDCGFNARSALEESSTSRNRLTKIMKIIEDCKYGIHDISRVELDQDTKLPRFNMAFELGVFLGAGQFGADKQKVKKCLILDAEPYRYQKYISDLAGNDVAAHSNDENTIITIIRDWLSTSSKRRNIPSGSYICSDYADFKTKLPIFCRQFKLDANQLTFLDYANTISEWLKLST